MPTPPVPIEELQEALDIWSVCGRRREEARAKYRPASKPDGLSPAAFDNRIKRAIEAGLQPSAGAVDYRQPSRLDAQQGRAPEYDLIHEIPDGLTLRGTSILYNENGSISKYWNKTKPQGLPVDETVQLPDPKRITKTATLYNEQGRVTQQWVSEKPELVALDEFVKEAVARYLEGAPQIPVGDGPVHFDTDVIPWFQIGDAHIGMLAHEAETGANFDLKIAEREMCAAFATLFDECPARERCVINDLGDASHYENMSAVTEMSRHQLDADGRFPKMIAVYIRIMRFIVDRALGRFKFVDVIVNQGNHSRTNDIWMAELLRHVYAHTGRVNVLGNSSVFIPYRMGNTFVMVHHSDKTKPDRLAQVMANDFRQDWGETEYRYVDVGHLHHKWSSRESAGCVIEMWNTLAAKDRYNHDGGYRAHQSITRVDRSKTYGEVGRRVLPIREIRDVIVRSTVGAIYIPPERRRVFTV